MSRQKAVMKSRREVRRMLKKDMRQSRYRNDNNVTSLVQIGGVEAIGMARENRDTSEIRPRNEVQYRYMRAIKNKQLVIADGEAGCGKTFISTAMAADALINKEVDKIIVTRPVLQAEEDLGYLPGDVAEKFAPYFRPVYEVLLKRMGASFLQYCLRPEIGKVEIAPFAYMRGRTFENAFVILDEAQNVTINQMKMFLTRLGENVTVIVNGDISQCDLPDCSKSGLADALERFFNDEVIGVIHFSQEDCVRSKLCQKALQAYSSPV
ncbi:phosphate starvation-inducible protein PhoH [Xenorhabdus sp. KK7.4]|uniref:phosphate starvation-inducible protein PhoH n=1 Tax=Xenorhabdus sp. KK7.4 TaxID=1851572 RepID=UPI000C040841|nr:phosphate starvation-inducible protein PhoH [Xenorhabdus sp. KK7.4]PHM54495.1 phoH-like protein [Xenorhabdus sp. KK7.4]